MIEAVLFDLDGTLLETDIERFMRHYLQDLSSHVAQLLPPTEFVECLMAATRSTVANIDPATTNEEAFRQAFNACASRPLEELTVAIEEYYATGFRRLIAHTRRREEARPLVERVLALKRKAVVATNPLFPLTAIVQRLEWADVADLPFALITSYENMHFTKPHPQYFQEIAERIGVAPQRCLMIGDDVELDGRPAMQIGMRFFWTTDDGASSQTRGGLAHLRRLIDEGLLDAQES